MKQYRCEVCGVLPHGLVENHSTEPTCVKCARYVKQVVKEEEEDKWDNSDHAKRHADSWGCV